MESYQSPVSQPHRQTDRQTVIVNIARTLHGTPQHQQQICARRHRRRRNRDPQELRPPHCYHCRASTSCTWPLAMDRWWLRPIESPLPTLPLRRSLRHKYGISYKSLLNRANRTFVSEDLIRVEHCFIRYIASVYRIQRDN